MTVPVAWLPAKLLTDLHKPGSHVGIRTVAYRVCRSDTMQPVFAADEITRLTAENERLRQEVEHYNKSGIVEIAVRNPSVADYMAHWEGRAEKAEAENERLRDEIERAELRLEAAAKTALHLSAKNERLREALKRLLLEVDFLIEGGYLTDIRDDVIFVAARAALEQP